MNEDNWYQDSDESGLPPGTEGPAPKAGMSTGMKVFIGIALVAGVMALLCCGGVFFIGSKLANMATNDPAEIQEIQEKIAGIELPEEWEPQKGIDGGMFGFEMQTAIYERGEAIFVLMQINVPGQISDEELRDQFRQGMQQQGHSTELDVETSEERTLTVAGEETTFDFVKGTDANGNEVRQVFGSFSGRGGPTILFYQGPEDDWNEEEVVQMMESIQK